MKKYALAFILMSLVLTGCGSAAGPADSGSTPAPDASSSSETAEESASSEESQEEAAQTEIQYFEMNHVDFPILSGMEWSELGQRSDRNAWSGGSESDPVYLAMEPVWDDGALNNTTGRALDELPDVVWKTMLEDIKLFYDASSFVTKKTVDSSSETQFLDYPVICEKGTILTQEDGINLNFVAYYTYMDGSSGNEKTVPSFWMAFTPSDSKEALDLMNEAADAPLTLAKMHESN